MKSRIADWMLDKSRQVANEADKEIAIEVGQHDIQLEFVEPESNNERHWDDLFERGNIYVRGFANPIKPDPEDADNMISTKRWKHFLDQDAYSDAFDTETDDGPDFMAMMLIGIMALQVGIFGYLYMVM